MLTTVWFAVLFVVGVSTYTMGRTHEAKYWWRRHRRHPRRVPVDYNGQYFYVLPAREYHDLLCDRQCLVKARADREHLINRHYMDIMGC